MKQIRTLAAFAVLCMILPLASYAQEHRHPPRAEISVVNDTDTQVTFTMATEKCGRWRWTFKPGYQGFLSCGPDKERVRARGDDVMEIADWGRVAIRDVAQFRDGAWYLSIRDARRELRHNR